MGVSGLRIPAFGPRVVPRCSPRATVVDCVLGGWDDVPGFGRCRRQARFDETVGSIASEEGCVWALCSSTSLEWDSSTGGEPQ